MPKHCKHSRTLICSVTKSKRSDNSNRYRITLPKPIGDSNSEIVGFFTFKPNENVIMFHIHEDAKNIFHGLIDAEFQKDMEKIKILKSNVQSNV